MLNGCNHKSVLLSLYEKTPKLKYSDLVSDDFDWLDCDEWIKCAANPD